MSRSWYFFMGGDDPLDVSAYHKITVQHTCLCGNEICAIYATGNKTRPEAFSNNMTLYIKNALATGQLQPDKPYSSKKYVYLK